MHAQLAHWHGAAVVAAGVPPEAARVRRRILHLRFAGQDATLEVDWRPDLDVAAAFAESYGRLFGHRPERREVEVECLPAKIPNQIRLDVTALHVGQHVEADELELPEDVELLLACLLRTANGPAPTWTPGDEFAKLR